MPRSGKSNKRPASPLERDVQGAVTAYLTVLEQQGKLVWWPIPNGQMLSGDKIARAKQISVWKSKGLIRVGSSDLGLTLAPHGRAALLELKRSENLKGSPEQIAFGTAAMRCGALFAVAGSFDQAKFVIDSWVRGENALY